ncbi:hypothetical protein [Vibrio harveyi]|uniref:hypothetical protein n=1 Tax=Vibrio harveyi TaxID=669 RepID=UPI003D74DA32
MIEEQQAVTTAQFEASLKKMNFTFVAFDEAKAVCAAICPQGHKVQLKTSEPVKCPVCEAQKKGIATRIIKGAHTIAHIAITKGGRVTPEIPFSRFHDPISLECGKGHKWNPIANDVRNGAWCPKCSKARRYTVEMMREFVEKEHEGQLVSTEMPSLESYIDLTCSKGHSFSLRGRQVVNDRTWCPTCTAEATKAKRQDEAFSEIKAIIEPKGGVLLSTTFINSATKLEFRCSEGHHFRRSTTEIRKGEWCERCKANEELLNLF